MHKAYKEIRKILARMDAIIEILDARIPFSSTNPAINKLQTDKPVIKLLNKADLADPLSLDAWQDHLEHTRGVKTLRTSNKTRDQLDQVVVLLHKLCADRYRQNRTINALITGIPNVGKSTIINRLAGKAIAKTGNEPAITRAQQSIRIDNGIILHDTPGILWPKIENPGSGYRLAITGGIRDTVTDAEDIALFAANYLLTAYPELLKKKFQLDELPATDTELIETIGQKRGCLRSGGVVDYEKAARLLLADLRSGALGKICLETPELIVSELTGETGQ